MLKQSEITDIFQQTEAYLSGHFQLTSGLHSPHYFQCAKVLQHPQHMTLLCTDIARKLEKTVIDLIVGPAMGGIVVAQEIGRVLNKRTIFSERENGRMTLRRGFDMVKGERVLIAEDVLTTGKSVREVMDIIREREAVLAGVAVIVDRSGGKIDFGVPLVSLMALETITYTPEACPLCRQGSPVVKPGSRKQEAK
ncbi:MAG: orotate phosphoribosyltransferase [Elusimicrobia bacterium RIFOXYB2_FULL_49_7]|nr:MAG: orotate phosphoribosyltransferase [Elusimicrobia bacterium RIFOXYB2_FULL_49_7]